jgi:hypothetical protein
MAGIDQSPRRRRKFLEAEQVWGMPFWDVVQMLARRGLSKGHVAELVGYSARGFGQLLRSPEAPIIEWAPLAIRREHPGVSEEGARNIREATRRQDRTWWLEIDGQRKPLTVWAEEVGLNPETIRRRYKRGLRGRQLIQPPMPRHERGVYGMRVRYGNRREAA